MRAFGLIKIAAFYLIMAGVSLAAIGARGGLRGILPVAGLCAWLISAAVGLMTGVAIVALTRIAAKHFSWAARLEEEFRSLVGELSDREAFAIAGLSGVGEELLFRGLLQAALGLWLGAAVFGLLHVGPNQRFAPWTVMAFAVGVLLGALCLWTGSLLAAILTHVTINFMNLRHLAERS
jgi:membrane protease YdiL (CAAX protease family)